MNHWPAPSLIEKLLFENFWPGLLVAGMVGLMLLFYARRLRRRGLAVAGAGCLVVAGLFPLLAAVVQTDREVLIARTLELPAAFVPDLDESALAGLFDERVGFDVGPSTDYRVGRDALIGLSRSVTTRYEFESVNVLAVDACSMGPDSGESVLHVRTGIRSDEGFLAGASQPLATQWRFEWRKSGGQWRLTRVHWLKFRNEAPTTGLLP